MGALVEDLRQAVTGMEETHVSWVFLGADTVWKVKKPVDLGFLDQRSVEARRRGCEAEIRVNRALAPDVYREVVPVTRDSAGTHHFAGEGEIVDWAVEMRRLPHERRADHLLAEGELGPSALDRLASGLAAFHRNARRDAEVVAYGTPESMRQQVEENFEQTREAMERHLGPVRVAAAEAWQKGFLRGGAGLFPERVAQGRICEIHGDLRLEHVYLEDEARVTVVDAIEFSDRFRCMDVCADVAFLAMDLTWHGRADLAELFLAAYAREADDHDLYQLVDFYESYRAHVRAKVASFLAREDSPGAARAEEEAHRYFLLTLAAERRSLLPPRLFLVGGPIGAGKSTVSGWIAQQIACPVVASDRVRKALAAVAPERDLGDEPWQGAYAPEVTETVYGELLRRAEVVLRSGRSVVLDATFRRGAWVRRGAELARRMGVPVLFLECGADREILEARLAARSASEGGVSDARAGLLEPFLRAWEPVEGLGPGEHVRLDTGLAPETVRRTLRRVLGPPPPPELP